MSPTPINKNTEKGYEFGAQGAQNISFGGRNPNLRPEFKDKYEEREFNLTHMAGVFRVFAKYGFNEGIAGHCSLRDPIETDTFWINPLGVPFATIRKSDLVHITEDGKILPDGNQAPINTAGFAIHSSIHKARPDINAACHTHSVHGKAYSAFGKPLEMISQDACIFYKNQAVYKNFGGVAMERDEGREIAKAAGDARAVILQNHGLLTMGQTIDEAAYLFTLMERSCQAQLMVDAADSKSKPKQFITDDAAEYTAYLTNDPETLYTAFQPDYKLQLRLDDDFIH